MFRWIRDHARRALRVKEFPEPWRAIVRASVHLYDRLSDEDRRELEGLIHVFLAEKRFEGAGGLVVDDVMRVTVAAQACVLLLHRDTDVYPELDTIVLYPHAYVAHATHREGAVVIERDEHRVGESWVRGLVVLAWDEVQRDVRSRRPGHNVVLHELAHQLDAEDGDMTGAPDLATHARYEEWARVLGAEYDDLHARLRRGLSTDIDAYAATSPAEFFAVVTEAFFERPRALARRHPALYAELRDFYRTDPAALITGARSSG